MRRTQFRPRAVILLPEGTSCLRLAGSEISIAAHRERLDEQPLVAEPARDLNRLLPQLPGRSVRWWSPLAWSR